MIMIFRLVYIIALLQLGKICSSSLISKVDTLIGTSYKYNISDVHDYGNTAPQIGMR